MRSAFQLGCRLGRCAKTNHERKDRDEGHAGQGWVSGMNRNKEKFEWNEEKREQKGGKAAFMDVHSLAVEPSAAGRGKRKERTDLSGFTTAGKPHVEKIESNGKFQKYPALSHGCRTPSACGPRSFSQLEGSIESTPALYEA